MVENTAIEWPDHSFNPWEGCQKVGPGCDNCYAEARNIRFAGGKNWGPGAPRRLTSDRNWRQPFKWNREALAKFGRPARVFCASLADVFDNAVPKAWRMRLWEMIRETPELEWILLTKRVGNIEAMLPEDWGEGYPNVTLMITAVNQDEADRDVRKLAEIPARRRGLSLEPLLGPIRLDPALLFHFIDWVIVGGESGPNARPILREWVRSLRDQCRANLVAFFFKQWGGATPKAGGRDLDGRTWSQFPASVAA